MLARKDDEIRNLTESNKEVQGIVDEYRRKYLFQYRKHFRELGKCYDASTPEGVEFMTNKAASALVDSLSIIVTEVSGREKGQKSFEKRLNAELEGIVSKIRADFPKFTDEDIRLICYMIVGFDTCAISVLMDMTKENTRVRRKRIRQKIEEYQGPNKLLYDLFFQKTLH